MSGSIVLAVKSVFDDSGLRNAQKEFGSVGKKLKGILGAVGLGVGLKAAVDALKDAGKAAVEDSKSQVILSNALKNTVGASDGVVASVEDQISKWQLASGVVDDQLRPAYQSLATATGSVTTANDLMSIAMDLAASKNISVEKAAMVLGKAYNGQTGALTKLMPQLKGSTNLFGDLQMAVKGASDAAANADPFSRINVMFDEMKETIGKALIPYIQKLATYLASPMGQKQMNDLAQTIAGVVQELGDFLGWVIQNRDAIAGWAIVIVSLAGALGIASAAMGVYMAVTKGAALAQALLDVSAGVLARNGVMIATGIAVIAGAVALLGASSQDAANAQNNLNNAANAYVPPQGVLQASPTGADQKPKNPMPGTVYTWWNYVNGKAVWWQQTWTGSSWTKPVKMTYTPAGGAGDGKPQVNPFDAFTGKMADDAKKVRALSILTGKGLSEGFAQSIVNSGKDWVTVYNQIVGSSASTLKALQGDWNKTADGLKELADAKTASYEAQKKADEDYAASVKDTFAGIRDSILGAFNITSMGNTTGGVMYQINKLIAQTKAFSKNIGILINKGLNSTLLNQLIAAGPEQGGQLAASLVIAPTSDIAGLNASYGEYQALSNEIAGKGTVAQMGSNAQAIINVTVNAGVGTNGVDVGKAIVTTIKQYEKVAGAVWAKA